MTYVSKNKFSVTKFTLVSSLVLEREVWNFSQNKKKEAMSTTFGHPLGDERCHTLSKHRGKMDSTADMLCISETHRPSFELWP